MVFTGEHAFTLSATYLWPIRPDTYRPIEFLSIIFNCFCISRDVHSIHIFWHFNLAESVEIVLEVFKFIEIKAKGI